MQADIINTCESLLVVPDKMEHLEGRSHRSNLVFDSVPEQGGRTWVRTERMI